MKQQEDAEAEGEKEKERKTNKQTWLTEQTSFKLFMIAQTDC